MAVGAIAGDASATATIELIAARRLQLSRTEALDCSVGSFLTAASA